MSSIDLLSTAFKQKLVISDDSVSDLNKILFQTDNISISNRRQANASLIEQLSAKFPSLDPEQTAEQHQWLTLSLRFPDGLEELNQTLKSRTYLLGTQEAALADVITYTRVKDLVSSFAAEQIKSLRHIVRWIDLIQNSIDIPKEVKIAVDADFEAPREIKVKAEKKKAEAAPASTAPAKKESKGKKVKADKKAGAVKKSNESETAAGADKNSADGQTRTERKEKKKKEKKPQPAKVEVPITPGMIDLRVGHIQKAIKHPDADSLYVSTIDMGDPEGPRTVCSGLVKHFPLEAMQDRYVIVVANLKPVTMRGIKSSAMVLCASTEDTVEFVNPPAGSKPGDKIFFESYDITPEPVLNPKKKIWETIQPGFSTTEKLEVVFKKEGDADKRLVNKAGELCLVSSLVNATVR